MNKLSTVCESSTARLLSLALLSLVIATAHGATWTGGGLTDNWSDTGNWLTSTPPAANGDTVIFDSNSTARLTTNTFDLAFTGLIINVNASFAGPNLTINGTQTLTPGSITLASTAATTLTLNLPVTVAATQTWTLNANKLVTNAAGTISATAVPLTITGTTAGMATFSGAITLNAATLNINGTAAASSVAFNTAIGGTGGGVTLTTTNQGTVTFGAANTYSGSTIINSGTLSFADVAALNTSSGITLAGQNSALNLARLAYTGPTATLSRSINLGTVASANVVNVPTAATVLSLTGNLTGGNPTAANVALLINGSGTVFLDNPIHANNSFTGSVTIDTATVRFTADNGAAGDPLLFGSSTGVTKNITLQNNARLVTANATQCDLTAVANGGTKQIVIGTGGGTIDVSSGANMIFNDAGQMSGSGLLTIKGNYPTLTNIVVFGNVAAPVLVVNTHTGGIVVDAATIAVSGQGSADPTFLGTGVKTITLQNQGRFFFDRVNGTNTLLDFSAGTKSIAFGAGGGVLEVLTATHRLILNDANQVQAGTGSTATIKGAGTVTWGSTAAATVAINHTGNVVIDGGTLDLIGQGNADPTNLGPGAKTLTIQNNGRLLIGTMQTGQTQFDPAVGTKSVVIGPGVGQIDVAANFTAILNDANQLSGSGTLQKIGAGTLEIGSQTVGFGGATGFVGGQMNLNVGTLNLRNPQSLGGGTGGTTAAIAMATGTTLNLRHDTGAAFGNNLTVTGTGTISVDRNTTGTNLTHTLGNFTMNAGASTTVNAGNGFGLAFSGTTTINGAATLTNNANVSIAALSLATGAAFTAANAAANPLTISGPTTLAGTATLTSANPIFLNGNISGGTTLTKAGTGVLVYNGTQAGTTALSVTGGTFSGIGTLLGAVSLSSGATLAPGDVLAGVNQAGTLSLNGGLTTVGGSNFNVQLGTISDLVNAGSANATVAGTLNIAAAAGFSPGTTYHLLQSTGTITNSLTLGTLPPNTSASLVVTTGAINFLDLVTTAPTVFTWNGSAGDTEWTTGGNWVGGSAPPTGAAANNAALVFPAGAPLTTRNGYAADTSFNSISFADNYVVSGNRLQLFPSQGSISVTAGSPSLNLDLLIGSSGGTVVLSTGANLNIGLSNSNTVTNNSGAGFLFTVTGAGTSICTINSTISGAGNLSVSTGGTLALTAANTYTGATVLSTGGTLRASSIPNGGVAGNLGASSNAAANLVLAGGTLLYNGGTASTDRNFTLNANSIINVSSAATILTLTGTNTNAFALIKEGSGTLALGGTTDNVALSATVNAGILSLAKTSTAAIHAIGTNLTVNTGGTARLGGSGNDQIFTGANVVLNSGGTLDLRALNEGFNQLNGAGTVANTLGTFSTLTFGESGGTDTFSGIIKDNVNIIKAGAGVQTLSGVSTFAGTAQINAGTLALSGGADRLPATTNFIFNGTSTFDLGNNPQTIANLTLNDAQFTATLANAPAATPLTTPLITFAGTSLTATTNAAPTTLTGGSINIGGGTINATGFPVTTATTDPAYTTSKVIASSLIGNGGITINSYGNIADNGGGQAQRFILSGTSTFTGGITVGRGFLMWVGDAALGAANNSITLQFQAGLLVTVPTTLPAARNVILQGVGDRFFRTYGVPNGLFTFQGNLSGTANLRTTDGGTVTFTGTNTNTGSTIIANSTKVIAGANNAFSSVSPVNIIAGGTLDAAGFTVSTGSLISASATAVVAVGTGTLNIGGDSASTTYAGLITGSGTLNKIGTGFQTVTNATIAYTGAINVNGGNLYINGTETGAAGLHSVANGALIGGSGTITGNVTLAAGGSFNTGNFNVLPTATTSTLTSASNALTMVPGSYMTFHINSAPHQINGAQAQNTFLNIPNGTAVLGNGTLNIIDVIAPFTLTPGVYRVANIKTVTGTLLPGLAPAGNAITSIAILPGAGAGATTAIDVTIGLAATHTWSGNGANNNWTTPANWNAGAGPAPTGNAGETLIFPAGAAQLTANNNFPAGTAFASIQLGGNYTITGNSMTLGLASSVISVTGGSSTFDTDLILVLGQISLNPGTSLQIGSAGKTLNNGGSQLTLANGGTLVINSSIFGSGALVQQTNAGVTTLNSANTYGGVTTISTGTIVLGNAAALGAPAVGTSVAVGATLDLNGLTISEVLTLNGGGVGGNGALVNNAAGMATASGLINNGTYTVGGTGDITLSGQVSVSATSTLTKIGNNTLTLSGTQDNVGLALMANGGTTVFAKVSNATTHAIGSASTINFGATVRLAGTGGLQIFQSCPVALSGGTLDLNGNSVQIGTLSGTGGTITDNAAGAGTSTLQINQAASNAYSGIISDGPTRTVALILAATAAATELNLNFALSTFSGGLVINSGRAAVTQSSIGTPGAITSGPFGKGTVTVTSASPLTNSGGQIYFNTPGVTLANNLVIAGRGGEGFGSLRFDPTGAFTVSGNVTLTSEARLGQAGTGIPVATFAGAVTGPYNLELFGNGNPTFVFANATATPNSWTGNTTVQLGVTTMLGASNQIPDLPGGGDVFVFGKLDLAGFSDTFNGLSGTGAIDASAGTSTLTIGNNNASGQIFNGVFTNAGGALTLAKTGAGVFTVTGANTHSGGTNVNAGTLTTTNLNGFGTGTVTLNGGTLGLATSVVQRQLNLTGFTTDVVRAASDPATTPFGTTGNVDNGGFIFYEHGTAGATQSGLPNSGVVTNNNNGIVYQLQPYTSNNILRVPGGTTQVLTVANGASLSNLRILHVGGSGAATYTMTLNFSDLTSTAVPAIVAPDWFNNTPFVINDLGRLASATGVFDNQTTNPRLYEFSTNLNAADSAKSISSISFACSSAATVILNIYAITGTFPPPGGQIYPNNVIVNANSVIDIQNLASATLGTLSIGANTLSLTGITGSNLTTGAVTLTGNPTFDPAPNTTLALGALADGATARTINKTGVGTLALNAAASSLINGTAANVNAGTLVSNDAASLGTLANVTLAANTSVAINANQTFGALNGSGGVVSLNGKTLTVGSTSNLASTFGGSITDGSGIGSFIKAGTGTLTLTGASTYLGTTTVAAGRLQLNGSLSSSASATTVSAGATLAGTGSLAVIVSNGTVAPGTVAAAGTLTAGSATFNSGSKLAIRIPSITSGQFDRLNMGAGAGTNLTINGGAIIEPNLASLAAGTNGEIAVVTYNVGTGAAFTKSFINDAGNTNHAVSYRNTGSPHAVLVAIGTAMPTPVTLDAFAARAEGAGVLLTWNTVSEYQNAGFHIFRRGTSASDWTRINPALIPGRITNPDAKQYAFYDWAPPGEFVYKLESVDLAGATEAYAHLAGPVEVDWNAGTVDAEAISAAEHAIAFGATVTEARWSSRFSVPASERSVSAASPLKPAIAEPPATAAETRETKAAARAIASTPNEKNLTAPSAGLRWFSAAKPSSSNNFTANKVVYSKPGVLLIPQSMLSAGYDVNHVSIQREGRNVSALALVPGGALVYAPGYQDEYTDKDALFLRRIAGGTAAGQVGAAVGLFASTLPVNVTTSASATQEFHDVYFDFFVRPYTFAPWFSDKYLTSGTTQRFTLDTPGAAGGAAALTLNLWSLTATEGADPDHALQVFVNGQPIGETHWDGGNRMLELSFNVPAGVLIDGKNQIDLVTPNIPGVDSQISFLHSISAEYTRLLDGSAPTEVFNTETAPKLFEIQNVPSPSVWVVDARYAGRETLLPIESQLNASGTYTVRFVAPSGGSGRFAVVPAGQENRPLSASLRQIRAARLNGTYLATGPAQFSAGVQPLLMARAKEGIRGQFADQEQLFDYYNHGRYGPAGIQNAVRAMRPQYLLLLGRTTYDYRNYGGQNVDPLCPAFLVSTNFWSQATSDSQFGDLGRGIPEVAVGRLPVNNAAELNAAVSRSISYKGMPLSGIRAHAVADRADPNAGNFGQQLSALAQSNPEIAWQANTLGVTHQSVPEVTAALADAANGGAELIVYAGHGNSVRLGQDTPLNILDTNLVQAWKGNAVFLQSTCTANWMAKNETGFKSIAIQALTQPQGGISASIASSTYVNSDASVAFMQQLLANANRGGMRWGRALMLSQQWALRQSGGVYSDLGHTEQIFGDPALPVLTAPRASSPTSSSGGAVTPGQF